MISWNGSSEPEAATQTRINAILRSYMKAPSRGSQARIRMPPTLPSQPLQENVKVGTVNPPGSGQPGVSPSAPAETMLGQHCERCKIADQERGVRWLSWFPRG